MLAYFRGQVDLGSRVFLVGLVFFGYGTYEYLKFTRRATDDDTGDPDEDTEDEWSEGQAVDDGRGDDETVGDAGETGTAVDRRDDHNG
jgi:hypothetical protein